MEYLVRSDLYQQGDEMVIIPPLLQECEKKIAFVTHDESALYANDGKQDLWLLAGENYIRKKNTGASLMVSEFQCLCHGTMRYEGETSRVLFKAGAHQDDW